MGAFLAWAVVSAGEESVRAKDDYGLSIFGLLLIIVCMAASFIIGKEARAADFPTQARVVDQPGLLSPMAKQSIERLSAQHERSTGNQVILVIVNDLGGLPVESYANQLARTWGIGQKGNNNGVLMLVGFKERKIRIEVGYGLEHVLPDAKAKRIISDMMPYLKSQKWDEGFIQGMTAITSTIRK